MFYRELRFFRERWWWSSAKAARLREGRGGGRLRIEGSKDPSAAYKEEKGRKTSMGSALRKQAIFWE